MPKPGVPFGRADDERRVPHSQPRVSPRLGIGRRAAPVLDQEQGQSIGRRLEIVFRIEGAEQRIQGNPFIKSLNQGPKRRFATDAFIETLACLHGIHSPVPGSA